MKRRPEAKRENIASCSVLSLNRPVHVRSDRRAGEFIILKLIKLLYLGFLVRPRLDTFGNRHGTDPYAWWCGREGDESPLPIPLMPYNAHHHCHTSSGSTNGSSYRLIVATHSGKSSLILSFMSLTAFGSTSPRSIIKS